MYKSNAEWLSGLFCNDDFKKDNDLEYHIAEF